MTRHPGKRPAAKPSPPRVPRTGIRGRVRRWLLRGVLGAAALVFLMIVVFSVAPVPRGPYMIAESWRLGGIRRDWEPMARIAPDLARSVVAAEDANFCLHWGFDMRAIRRALDEDSGRGASTISQQVVKNVFLWQGRSWPRKALEAVMTPVVEAVWTKRRILEVYLNVAEFGKGVFGAEAAAQHYFGISAEKLSPTQAARLAAILPDPKRRDAAKPSAFVRERTSAIMDGAATIKVDGRARCFEE